MIPTKGTQLFIIILLLYSSYIYIYIYNIRTVSFLAQITNLRYYTKGKVEHIALTV